MPSNDIYGNPEALKVWLSARATRNPVTEVMRDTFDGGDQYASVMQWWFAIADYLTDTFGTTPDSWEFRQSPFGSDTEAYEYRELSDLSPTEAQLVHAGNILERYAAQLRLSGMAY